MRHSSHSPTHHDEEVSTVLIVLCGIPRAGKTTIAQRLQSALEQQASTRCQHIEYDRIETRADETYKNYRCRVLNDAIVNAVRADRSNAHQRLIIIVYDTMHRTSMRHELFSLAQAETIAFAQVYVACDATRALSRNVASPSVSPATIERLGAEFDEPRPLDNWWEADTVRVDSSAADDVDIMPILAMVERVFRRQPVWTERQREQERLDGERLASRQANSVSDMHQLDLALRRNVAECIANARSSRQLDSAQIRQLAGDLTALRRQCLAFSDTHDISYCVRRFHEQCGLVADALPVTK